MRFRSALLTAATIGTALFSLVNDAQASSHREAPFIAKNPKVDASDFYMFQSYGGLTASAASTMTTIIANYEPLQDPAGGPNFYPLDPDALYEIHIDNNGDGVEDLTFQFQFQDNLVNAGAGLTLPIGPDGGGVAPPFINIGSVPSNFTGGVLNTAAGSLQAAETYTVGLVTGPARGAAAQAVTDSGNGSSPTFYKPVDNIGFKSFGTAIGGTAGATATGPGSTSTTATTAQLSATYTAYATGTNNGGGFIRNIAIPGCATPGKVFVGQRHESFSVELGVIFDLINANKADITNGANNDAFTNKASNIFNSKNVTSIALEIPTSCLLAPAADFDGGVPTAATTIGGWTTASVRQARVINPDQTYASPSVEGGPWAQVSRLGMPLVNEVVIGLKDKDKFNSSAPVNDLTNFATYVEYPTLAAVIDVLFGPGLAPTVAPRADLVAAFVTGVPGVNANGAAAEMVRLNTALPATPRTNQNRLGAAGCFKVVAGNTTPGALKTLDTTLTGCDPAGFPNGRRPGDDIVDIELRVMEGYLFNNLSDAPARDVQFVDGANQVATQFDDSFPYLQTPYAGSDDPSNPHK